MLKKFGRGLLTLILMIIMAGLSIIQIGFEVVYQIVRLIKRGYDCALDEFLKLVKPIYNGGLRIRLKRKPIKDSDDIKIYEFDYETEEP